MAAYDVVSHVMRDGDLVAFLDGDAWTVGEFELVGDGADLNLAWIGDRCVPLGGDGADGRSIGLPRTLAHPDAGRLVGVRFGRKEELDAAVIPFLLKGVK